MKSKNREKLKKIKKKFKKCCFQKMTKELKKVEHKNKRTKKKRPKIKKGQKKGHNNDDYWKIWTENLKMVSNF
jgi:hypothetical protein